MHYRTWLFCSVDGYRSLAWIMHVSGILQLAMAALCIISVFAQCSPVEGNWNPTVPSKCWDQSIFLGFNYTSSAITFVSYMIQAWIPIRFALGLQNGSIPKRQWAGLIVLAAWNVIAGVLALIKIGYLHQYVITEDASMLAGPIITSVDWLTGRTAYRRVPLVEVGL